MAKYHIDPTNGNDSWDGLAGAFVSGTNGPWKTRTNATGLSTSDGVYGICGDGISVTGNWTPDWAGVSGTPAIIGSYYMDGGSEVYGVSGNRFKITGAFGGTYAELPTAEPDYNYSGTIQIVTDYFKVQDIWIYRSSGTGILVGNSTTPVESPHISNCLIDETQTSTLHFYSNWTNKVSNYIAEDCTFNRGCLNGSKVWSWPACLNAWKGSNGIIRNNVFKYNYGEQIIVGDNSQIYGNEFYNYHALGVYLHWSVNNDVYNNLMYGGTDDTGYPSGGRDFTRYSSGGVEYVAEAVAWGEEYDSSLQVSSNNRVYNNLAARCINFFFTTMADVDSSFDGYIYHNTIVDCANAFHFTGTNSDYSGAIKNNIIAHYESGLGTIVPAPSGLVPSNIDWDYNHWPEAVDSNASGANDIVGDPSLSKSSGWHAVATYGGLTASDFALTSTSTAIDAGLQIAGYLTDYNGVSRGASTTDMGAQEYAASGGWTLNNTLEFMPYIFFQNDDLTGYGGPFYPYSQVANSTNCFFGYFTGSGGGSLNDFGLGIKASIGADTTWSLRFAMPPAIPTGDQKLAIDCLSSGTGDALIQVKWAVVAVGDDPSSATLVDEGTTTLTWVAADDGKYKIAVIDLDGSTITADSIIAMDLIFKAT